MRKLLLVLSISILAQVGWGQTTIKKQSFETSGDTWTPMTFSTPPCTNGSDRWDYSTTLSTISPSDGSRFWGIQDLNGNCGGNGFETISLPDVDVSSYTSVTFSFDYNVIGFDNGDDLKYRLFYDNTAQTEVVVVDGNSNFSTSGWVTETVNIPSSVTNVRVVLSAKQNGGSDYAGFDNIVLKGTLSTLTPEINLQGNNTDIVSGDNTPSTTDDTDFGDLDIAAAAITKTFTIQNTGTADLSLTGTPAVAISGSGSSAYTITQPSSTTIAANGNVTFSVSFDPVTVGNHPATISIANNDSDENPYTFAITGQGTTTPTITLSSANPAVAASNIIQGTSNNVIYAFDLSVADFDAELTALSIGTSGTFSNSNITNMKAWYSTDNTFDASTDTQLGNNMSHSSGTYSTTAFTQSIANGSTGYIFITTTLPCNATDGNTITVNAITTANLTFTNGNKTGTAYAGGTQTITSATPNNITGLATSNCQNGGVSLSWTNPSTCFDNVIVVASPNAITTAPSGNGSAYTANVAYGSGTSYDGGHVVYKGSGTSVNITGLTNGTAYNYKVFTRNDLNWSSGVEVSCTPNLVYCASSGASSNSSGILNVAINTINNGSVSNNGYFDYTTISTDLEVSNSYSLSVNVNTNGGYTSYVIAWIDWNQNGIFENSEKYELGSITNDANGQPSNSPISVVVPATAVLGNTKMRISANTESSLGGYTTPCQNFTYGEVEDYVINVISSCTPTHTITSIAPTSGPIGTDVKITGTGFTAATTATIGGIAATVTYNSATELIVEIPTGATSNEIVLTESACEANSASFTITTASGTCTGLNNFTDIIISEVYDSEANNVWYVELFNPTNAAIDLATGGYALNRYADLTTSTASRNIALTGTIPAGSVFLLNLGNLDACTKTWDFTSGGPGINEEDRNELTKNGTVIDVVHFPNEKGYSVKRDGNAAGPTATYSASDWIISSSESCADLGTAPISTFSNPTTTSIADQTACELDFSVSVTEGDNTTTGDITYQWYYNNGAATTWTAVSSSAPTGLTILGEDGDNLLIGTGTNDISTISGYQFYCEVTEATTCKNVSNAATFKFAPEPFFRTKQSGVWKNKANWEMATSATGTWSAACTYPTAENSNYISIENGHTITIVENPAIDPDISADQLIVQTGATLILGDDAELHIEEDGATGSDFEIKGTYIDASSSGSGNGITFNNGATWSIVANATIMKTNTSSATHYRDNYETGIANIPATANWVYRYDGTGNVSIANSANGKPMYYPNLTFESTNGAHSFNTVSQVFTGRYEKVTVKGDLTIGSNAANAVTVYNNNFNTEPMLITGGLYINAGSKLTNEAYISPNGNYNSSWREGAGFELKGGAIIEGTFDVTHKTTTASSPANAIAPGSEGVIFSGTAKQDIFGGTAESFITNDATINNTNHIELTNINIEIEDELKFTTGKIITTTTTPDMVWVKNNATTAIVGGNTSGTNNYVEGKLQWTLATGNTYTFPVGHSAQNAQGFKFTPTGAGNVLAYLETNNTNPVQAIAYCDLEQYPTTGAGTVNAGNGTAGYDGILDQITFNLQSPLQWDITNPGGGVTAYDVEVLANGGQDISPVTTANGVAVRYLLKNGQAYNGATAAGTTNGASGGFSATGFEACPNQYTLSGMTSFSKFTLNGAAQASTVLPIELLSFSATLNQSKVVDLEWITATEINNDYFTLERSKNGKTFEAIGSVKGAGNSNEKLTYSYVDTKPYQGVSYYRLKQTDFDGQFSYSKIKAIGNNTLGENVSINIYPNPVKNLLHVEVNNISLESEKLEYFIYDHLGKLVQEGSLKNKPIDVALLHQGIYRLKIANQNIDKSFVFVKK